jgi:hypothetical protein
MAIAPLVSLAQFCRHDSDAEERSLAITAAGLLVLLVAAVLVVLEPLTTAAASH